LAHDIAVKMAGQKGLAVPPRDAKAMRDAVMNDPVYAELKAHPKGRYNDNGLRL
jgi:hypothetical protein